MTPEIYCDVFASLERAHVRYVVVGSAAVVLHGLVRPIADLDLVVASAPDEANRAMQALMQAGFVPSIPLLLSELPLLRMFDCSQREIDVFVRFIIPFDELWAGSECVRVGDGVARVMSLEHLLRERRGNGRPRDLSDIEGLLALAGREDEESVGAVKDADERDESAE